MLQQQPYFLLGGVIPALFLLSKSSIGFGPYYDLEDVTRSTTAASFGLMAEQKAITPGQLQNARRLAIEVLNPAAKFLGNAPDINSWFRSPELNELVGGATQSTHLDARAADVKYYLNYQRRNDLLARAFLQRSNFDRMLLEKGTKTNPQWIHIEVAAPGTTARRKIMYTPDGSTWQNISQLEALTLFG